MAKCHCSTGLEDISAVLGLPFLCTMTKLLLDLMLTPLIDLIP